MIHTHHKIPRKWLSKTWFTHSCQCTKTSTFIMQSPDKFSGCTLLIIPSTLYDAHSSLFTRKWLSIYLIYTLLTLHSVINLHSPDKFTGCILIIIPSPNMMHTPHYSQGSGCTLLIIQKTVAESKQELHTPSKAQWIQLWQCTRLKNLLDAHSSLFHQLYMMHTPDYLQGTVNSTLTIHSPDAFNGCTLLIIPSII